MARLNKVKTQDKKFTCVFNEVIQDKTLSWKARGIFIYLWSLPDNWSFSEMEIMQHSIDGRSALRSGLQELEDHHYLKRASSRNSDHIQVGHSQWILSDKQMSDNQTFDNKMSDKQMSDNQTLQNNHSTKYVSKQSNNLTNTNNSRSIKRWIGNQLQGLGIININSFIYDDIDDWAKHYSSSLIKRAVKQVAETNPSPTWVVKDISTQLSRGCKTHQPGRHSGTYQSYGRPVIHQKLPKWARDDYHPKLHPTDPKLLKRVREHLKELNAMDKRNK